MTVSCLTGPGVTLAQPNPTHSRPKRGGKEGLFLCPSYPGQVSYATALRTTTVRMEAPHWPWRDTQVAAVCSTFDTVI